MIYRATMVVSYRVTMVVSDYILLAVLLQFHNLAQLLCNFGPICSCPSRIGQPVEPPSCMYSTNNSH